MTRLRRFADVGSRISTCFLSIGVHAEHFTQQNKRKAAFSMICPYIVFSALFHCSLYRGHIIARAAICFGNLELYFLAEQKQKYLLLTQPIHTKCGRLLLRTILNHAIHDGIIWQKSPKCAIICRLLVCEIVSLIGSGHQNFTWFALRYSVGDVPSMLLNVLQK